MTPHASSLTLLSADAAVYAALVAAGPNGLGGDAIFAAYRRVRPDVSRDSARASLARIRTALAPHHATVVSTRPGSAATRYVITGTASASVADRRPALAPTLGIRTHVMPGTGISVAHVTCLYGEARG